MEAEKIFLRQIAYPHERVLLWAIPASEVQAVVDRGNIPQIFLPLTVTERKPKIAVILAQDTHPEREEKDYTIFPDYAEAVIRAGGTPIFISYDKVEQQLETAKPDGILLIGGNFRLVKNQAFDRWERRPQTYVSLIEYARANRLPLFAVCGGEQMLGVYLGGRVKVRINENCSPQQSHLQKPYQLSHVVNLVSGSLIHRLLQKDQIEVNSCHNSAIIADQTGETIVTGVAPDGVVEVIELKNPWHPFVLGVQWHPERMAKMDDDVSLKLFSSFVEAAAAKRKKC